MTIDALTEKVIGWAYRVHNELGAGFLEKVYENALRIELFEAGLDVKQQHPIPVRLSWGSGRRFLRRSDGSRRTHHRVKGGSESGKGTRSSVGELLGGDRDRQWPLDQLRSLGGSQKEVQRVQEETGLTRFRESCESCKSCRIRRHSCSTNFRARREAQGFGSAAAFSTSETNSWR